jgi:hypothetical protein
MPVAALDTTLEEAQTAVPVTWRLTGTNKVRAWKVVGLGWLWEEDGSGAAAMPQHEEVCGREALSVRLSSRWKGQSYCPVVKVQEKERCRQEECEFQNFGQQQSDV